MISDSIYTYRQKHFTSENASFCDICLQLSWRAAARSGHLTVRLHVDF